MTQKQALDILKLGHNVFLTGPAGSGKTYVLNTYIAYLKKHHISVAVTASTGIAATHMQGKTIHSWAHIGIKDYLTDHDLEQLFKRKDFREAITEAQVLIIDEVSMLHHYRLDMVDAVLRKMHGTPDQPFGGIQVVLCGDLFQLPPVTRSGSTEYVTAAAAWDAMNIQICYLSEQYRHEDDHLSQLLNEIRAGEVSELSLERLLARKGASLSTSLVTTKLYTHNADVDTINAFELTNLPGSSHKFQMKLSGDKAAAKALAANCLAPEELELKHGAVVMFVQNNYAKGYVNGTLGIISGFDDDLTPIVQTHNGRKIVCELASWSVEEGDEVIAEIKQFPLRLAWAITVHKSQGMTLDAAKIDLTKSFVPGMGYVALSRVRRLDSLSLVGIGPRALQVDPRVIDINIRLLTQSKLSLKKLSLIHPNELKKQHQDYIHHLTYTGSLFA